MEILKKNSTIILTVVLAIAAAVIIYFSVKAMSPTTPVVVANQNLNVGTTISKEHLTTRNFPANNIPSTAFSFTQDLVGKTIVNGPVVQGDMIRSEHLSLDGSLMAVLKTYAPEGWTAIALPGGEIRGLKKGDRINIYGEVGTAQGIIVSELVKNAIVLSIPNAEKNTSQYIIAVPDNYAPVVAEITVRGKPIAVTLPSKIVETVEEPIEEITEEIHEVEGAEE
mgnify:CR=1 FL=1